MQLSKNSPSEEGKWRLSAISSRKMVGVLGVEPRTSSLSGTRSNQLSYTPNGERFSRSPKDSAKLVEPDGFEPTTS